ncbi:UvsW helicase [Luteitalea pratensis]|uniref:UvsW helicase n=1 Tax=Luteitalea pratensis TaxID=1855912 RepID=A0A143PJE0_LUTPR|nr:UvsW helicase [Luteitalea pratensis]
MGRKRIAPPSVMAMESNTPRADARVAVDRLAPASAKIAVFRSLFRGRDDVYPRRFESRKTGRSGYAPACAHEWVRGICEKPRIKCAECAHRRFLPVTDEVIRWHLSGQDAAGQPFVAGVYPLLLDETCFFLAADFDKTTWRDDALAYANACRALDVPAAIERSRSGQGAHVWIFFDEALPAALARRLGTHLLTEAMESRPDMGFDSYDRLFPNQDTLPKGGFGNLIALPLQRQPRALGHTVFLTDDLEPVADQWAYLARVRKAPRTRVEAVVQNAERHGRVIGVRLPPEDEDEATPWTAPPSKRRGSTAVAGTLPATLELILANQVYVAKDALPPGLRNHLLRLAAFQNPEFYKAQAMRLSTHDTPRVIACAEDHAQHIALPRGCLDDVRQLLDGLGVRATVRDERRRGGPLDVAFQGELRPEQRAAATAMIAHDTGVLAATTAFGKTVVAAWLIAQRRVNTLVLVHRRQLQDQWVERLSAFLAIEPKSIGRIGGGMNRPTGLLDVALIQSLARKGVVDDRVADYGHVIVDECHHLSAHSFEQVVRQAKARYVVGLSATVARKDGHHPIITMQCGPVRHHVSARAQAAARPFEHYVRVQPTSFRSARPPDTDKRVEFHTLYQELVEDGTRNRRICEDVLEAVRMGRSPLLLTERNDHLDRLERDLGSHVEHLVVLRAGMRKKQRRALMERLAAIPHDAPRVILATGKYIGEGFDDARLDTLFLTLPVSWRGTIAQYAGRLHRLADGKREVQIFDYADLDVPMLARMFDRRCRGYEAVGYTVLLPASAIPGWPGDVVLPSDPVWKRDYSGSVRRLVRDGVDTPLASLFVHAARDVSADAEGADRARSATEAFLYRRLQSLPETRGRFTVNESLPVAFDGMARLEVDLLCTDARVAVELDGAQHLADPVAYRRDRRKDRLLQESGYLVLRFLAEDVGKELDTVLDDILRALAARRDPEA